MVKAFLKLFIVFLAGWLWIFLLEFADRRLSHVGENFGLPDALGIILAVGLSFAPWLIGYMVVLCRSWRLKRLNVILRWSVYLIVSVALAVGSFAGGGAVRTSLGYSPEMRAPGREILAKWMSRSSSR